MSRSTQYIGLTKEAKKIVKSFVPVVESRNWTCGMFGEEVPLGEWFDGESYVREEVQLDPWSGGPMIFTCLSKYKAPARGTTSEEGGMYLEGEFYSPEDRGTGEVISESLWAEKEPELDEFGCCPEYNSELGEVYFGKPVEEQDEKTR